VEAIQQDWKLSGLFGYTSFILYTYIVGLTCLPKNNEKAVTIKHNISASFLEKKVKHHYGIVKCGVSEVTYPGVVVSTLHVGTSTPFFLIE
jgi:hypothetical protein